MSRQTPALRRISWRETNGSRPDCRKWRQSGARGVPLPLAARSLSQPALLQLHATPDDRDALGQQQRAFHQFAAAIAAEPPARRNHPVARHVRPVAVAHDVPDGARRARPARECRHIAVRGHAPRRNPPHD